MSPTLTKTEIRPIGRGRRTIETAQECLDWGLVQATMGDSAEALSAYRRALEIEPDNSLGHYMLGLILMEQGREHEARDAWQAALNTARAGSQAAWARHKSKELLSRYCD